MILRTLWLVVRADAKTTAEESWLFAGTVERFKQGENGEQAVAALDSLLGIKEAEVQRLLIWAPRNLREAAFDAACLAAMVDHELSWREHRLLRRLAKTCGIKFDRSDLERRVVALGGKSFMEESVGD